MADIEKISVGGTSYDVRDALAAHALSDIAVAGSNITFSQEFSYNMQKQGEPTLVDGTATGFSSTKYLYETDLPDDNVTYYFKIKMPSSLTWADIIRYGGENQPLLFLFAIWDEGGGVHSLRVWNETAGRQEVIIPQISANMTYWLKVQISGDEKTYSYSTDGTNYTQSLVVNDPQTVSRYLQIGGGEHTGFYNGTVYLNECYAISGDTEVWRGATLDKASINASVPTVDQTYNSASSNAQSGVAIDGAGFLKNSATGSNSLTILGNATGYQNGVNIGAGSKVGASGSTAIGFNAQTEYGNGVAIGYDAYASGNAVCIGHPTVTVNGRKGACNTNTIAIGQATAGNSEDIAIGVATAYGTSSIAIGRAGATANYAIQLGCGTNNTANTFSVGLGVQASENYRLLESDGTIPSARMPSDVLKNTATGSNSICILGNASGDANGSRSVAIGTDSYASQNNCVAIGNYAAATGYTSVAVGMCQATANYAIQLGTGKNVDANTFSVGLSNSLNVRLLNSDGTIPGERMALQGTEAPTTSTAGSVGQFYVDTTNQIGYMCVSTADSAYVWKQITA